jgi:integrase
VRFIAKGVKAMSVKVRPYRNGGWEVDITFRLPDGRKYRERSKAPVDSKSGALRWGQDRERHLLQHGPPQPKKEVPTLEKFAPRFIEGHAKANRQKPSGIAAKEMILRVHLLPALGHKRLDMIKNEDVQRLKHNLQAKSPKTVNNVLAVLSVLLKKAVEWEVIERMPCSIKLLRVSKDSPRFFDFDEYERLVDAARILDSRTYLIVLLGGEAGLRCGEMIALEWDDVDFVNRRVCVRRSDWNGQVTTPKSGRVRWVPLTRRLAVGLSAHRHLRSPRVLCQDNAEPLTRQMVQTRVKSAARKAGLSENSVHVLRHTFCSHLAMRGAPARAIQEAAGHKELGTTQRYMHVSPAALEDAIRLLEFRHARLGRGEMLETGAAAGGNVNG